MKNEVEDPTEALIDGIYGHGRYLFARKLFVSSSLMNGIHNLHPFS